MIYPDIMFMYGQIEEYMIEQVNDRIAVILRIVGAGALPFTSQALPATDKGLKATLYRVFARSH